MAITNPMNNGVATGRLVSAPTIKMVSKNAASVQFRLGVLRNFKTKGSYETDFLLFNSYFAKAAQSKLLARLKDTPQGGFISVAYHVQSYETHSAVHGNKIQLSLVADSISFINNSGSDESHHQEDDNSATPF